MSTGLCTRANLSFKAASQLCCRAWTLTSRHARDANQLHFHYSSTSTRHLLTRLLTTQTFCKKDASRRPTLDDVERISRGDAAKARGTGSRRIPHRLNAEERQQYDIAKQKGFLTLKGTGYRKERKGSPLANTFRQWCDAQARLCVVIQQGSGADAVDTVLVDLSPLRSVDNSKAEARCKKVAAELACSLSQDQGQIPFTIELQHELGIPTVGAASALQQHVQAVHTVKTSLSGPRSVQEGSNEQSSPNEDDESQAGSQHSHELLAHVGPDRSAPAAAIDYTQLNSKQRRKVASPGPLAPIWTVPAQPICFDADRSTAKELAKGLVAEYQ